MREEGLMPLRRSGFAEAKFALRQIWLLLIVLILLNPKVQKLNVESFLYAFTHSLQEFHYYKTIPLNCRIKAHTPSLPMNYKYNDVLVK
jgi:hypothetical protein